MSETAPLFQSLTEGQVPRTWSVLVTVFGVLAQAPGEEIASPILARLGEAMGLKPEALRVALHRLRKEGWITARRSGRHSIYALTDQGRAETLAASPRIYGPGHGGPAFLVASDREVAGIAVAPTLWVTATRPDGGDTWISPLDSAPPGWIRARLAPGDTADLARDMRRQFAALTLALPPHVDDPVARTALRVLTVHGWRRLALRLPALPDHVLPGGDDIRAARAAFHDLLGHLPAAPIDDLS